MTRRWLLFSFAFAQLATLAFETACGTLVAGDDGASPPGSSGDGSVGDGPAPAVDASGSDGGPDAPEILAASEPGAFGIAADDDYVFWTTHLSGGAGAVRRYTKATRAVDTLMGGLDGPRAIALSASDVYVTIDGPGDTSANGSVRRIPRDGGPYKTSDGESRPRAIATENGLVAWSNESGGADGAIRTATLDFTAPTSTVADSPAAVALDDGRVIYGRSAIASTRSISRVDPANNLTETAGDALDVKAMATSTSFVFFTSASGVGRVARGAKFASSVVLFDGRNDAIGIATDPDRGRVYFVTSGGGLLYSNGQDVGRDILPDGPLRTPGALYLAADTTALYWTWQSGTSGRVYAMKKPP